MEEAEKIHDFSMQTLQDIQYLKEKKIFTKYTCYVSVFFILVV
jgi:hypothetical protein